MSGEEHENGLELIKREHAKALKQVGILQRQVSLDLAKMAGMAEALRLVLTLTDDEGVAYKSDWLRIEFGIEKALQSAPDVAYHKVIQVTRNPDSPDDLAGWSEEDDGNYMIYLVGDHQRLQEETEYRVIFCGEGEEDGERDS